MRWIEPTAIAAVVATAINTVFGVGVSLLLVRNEFPGKRIVSALLDLFTMAAVTAGVLFFLAGVVGLLRFPDALTRLHALTKADNVGLGLIVAGLLPQAGSVLAALKLLLVWLAVLLAGATVGQLFARVARRARPRA